MGHAPDWMRANYAKVKKFADGGDADNGLIPDKSSAPFEVKGSGSTFQAGPAKGAGAGGRVGFKSHLDDDRFVELGASGQYNKVKVNAGDFNMKKSQAKLTGVDATYVDTKNNYDIGASFEKGMTPKGEPTKTVTIKFNKRF